MNSIAQTLDALYAVGHKLIGQDRCREAISLFRTMLLVDARDERGWLALATCHERLDEPQKAIALCRLALSACEGKAVRCAVACARIHRALGENDEALDTYADAARLADALGDHEIAGVIAMELGSP
jgi:tetratricopeptide (TPR) repeat protein